MAYANIKSMIVEKPLYQFGWKRLVYLKGTINSPRDPGQIGNKTCYISKVCKFLIEKGYLCQVSSLACKCVFYRPKHYANGRPHGIEFSMTWNAKMKYTNRARVICLVIIFNHRVLVLKVSKIAHFLYLPLMTAKN